MDGHYVPNLCFSLDGIKAIKSRFPEIVIDTHIMVTNPADYIQRLYESGAQNVAFHSDATNFSFRLIQSIHSFGMEAGIVLNPSQSISCLLPVIKELDYVLIMSVEPGFAGQKFIDRTYEKVESLAQLRKEQELNFKISVDGGITLEVAKKLKVFGADILILGFPAIFNQPDGISSSFLRFKMSIEREGSYEKNIY